MRVIYDTVTVSDLWLGSRGLSFTDYHNHEKAKLQNFICKDLNKLNMQSLTYIVNFTLLCVYLI